MSQADLLARARLSAFAEPGDPRLARLVARLGAVHVHDMLANETDLHGDATEVATRLAEINPEQLLSAAARRGIRFMVPGQPEWPSGLGDLDQVPTRYERGGAPLGLWVRGAFPLTELHARVAVVGSRSASSYGINQAEQISAGLAQSDFIVLSGGAVGIDTAAHRGAVASFRPTVAVLAGGVDRPYPQENEALLDYIAEHGAVISETSPGGAPTRIRFLARNRLIAAMSQATVVVEAAIRSGALNTATWAGLLSRQVLGVPGSADSPTSQGIHELIRTGGASLVSGPADVLEQVGASGEHLQAPKRAPIGPRDLLSPRQQQVLEAVPRGQPAQPESIARSSGIGLLEVQGALIKLHARGLVEQHPGGWQLARLALESA